MLILLYYNLIYLYYNLFYMCLLQIESMVDSLLYTKSTVVFLVPLLTFVHLFNDMLLFALMTTTLM